MSVVEREVTLVEAPLEPLPETPVEARILELAADILEGEGWCQGSYSSFGNRCALGGIGAAVKRLSLGRKSKERRKAERALAHLVRETHEESGEYYLYDDKGAIVAWNDSSYTRREQVVRKMREAAASLMPTMGRESR